MNSFPLRDKKPERTCKKCYAHYRSFKPYIQIDFNNRCGYCNTLDDYYNGPDYFHIDHFAPKRFAHLLHEYSNLVYSCPFCNENKSDFWPSDDPIKNIENDDGFYDPCCDDYDKIFYRNNNGYIISDDKVGEKMISRLGLHAIRHSILWKLDIIATQIDQFNRLNEKKNNKLIKELAFQYYNLLKELKIEFGKHC